MIVEFRICLFSYFVHKTTSSTAKAEGLHEARGHRFTHELANQDF
jgi:hypothetical protein